MARRQAGGLVTLSMSFLAERGQQSSLGGTGSSCWSLGWHSNLSCLFSRALMFRTRAESQMAGWPTMLI